LGGTGGSKELGGSVQGEQNEKEERKKGLAERGEGRREEGRAVATAYSPGGKNGESN